MNRLEQRFHDAAPPVLPALFPLDVKAELELIPHWAENVEPITAARRTAGRSSRKLRPRALALLLLVLVGAAIWLAPAASQSPEAPGSAEEAGIQPRPGEAARVGTPPWLPSSAYSSWRTVLVSRPWTDAATEVTATLEMPAEWKVLRHNVSPDYPGLHFTVLDPESLPVAMFYFGPVPAAAACRPRDGQQVQLERVAVRSGAEILNPDLVQAFSFSISGGPEPRGSFGLQPPAPDEGQCDPQHVTSDRPTVVLDFGATLALRTPPGSAPAPRSSYARSFPSPDEAKRYMKSPEYRALKRMITSLGFSIPLGISPSWQIPQGTFRESL